MTGDPLGRGFPGAMTMMVVRSLVSNAAHTIGRNGNQPRSGSGNSKPNAPTGPRSGGAGSASNVNAPSHANGYHHSTSAQQNSANPAFNQESISAQTVAAQTDAVQSAAEKMAGAFPQAAPAGAGKQPNSTRKTAVPPGTRRAPGHVAAPTAGKTASNAPYHRADTSQPVMGSAAAQNTQQEQTVHSQSESHPRSSASAQNHAGAVSFGAAGKTAGQNPPRTTVQPTGPVGKSYHSSNAQGQTVQAESAQQRSTFVQPPDTQRGAPGMAFAPNAMPNNPASTSATPRSPAQPVGSAGMPNHPNGSQVRNTQAESVQQRSTFVQAPNMAGAQPAADHPASPASPRSGMAGNPSVPHSSTPPIPAQNGVAGKQPDSHSAPARDTAGTGTWPQQPGSPQNAPAPGTAGAQRTSIGGRYTQPVQQTTRVSANGTTQITQQNHVSAQQSGGTVQPSSGVRMDGRSTNREHPAPTTPVSPAAPTSNREAGASPRPTTRPDSVRPAEQRASQRPIPAQSGSAEKPIPQTGTQASPVSAASSERQSRKPATPSAMGSMTASAPVSQESRGPQRSPAAESSAKRPVPQERRVGTQPEPQKKEQTLYHHPGTAGIAPTAVGINTEAASAAQKPAAEKAAKKPFVPLTGRTPESIPSHLDLHETSQKTTKRPQENNQEVTSDE